MAEPSPDLWLTTLLRPAGSVAREDEERLVAAVEAAASTSGVVLVDLSAVGPLPRSVRRALEAADAALTSSGGALLVADPDDRHVLPAGTGTRVDPALAAPPPRPLAPAAPQEPEPRPVPQLPRQALSPRWDRPAGP